MRKLFLSFLVSLPLSLNAQILFTESYTVILDTSRNIKGTFLPGFKYQNLKKDLIEYSNQADLSILIKNTALTFANNIEVTRFGNETILSGGYIYGEFRHLYEKCITIESYGQVHWADARGLDRKYAGGINARFRIHKSKKWAFFGGVGPFYEYEKWNFGGVANDNLIPPNESFREQENIKAGAYASFKYKPTDFLFLDLSGYYQSEFDQLVKGPRLASSSRITYNFTKVMGLALTYQNIYDPSPLVPINELFHKLDLGLSITF